MAKRHVQRARSDFWGCPRDPPEEVRLRNVPAGILKTAICLRGEGASVSAQGLHVLKSLLMDIRSKGREKPSCTLKLPVCGCCLRTLAAAGFAITKADTSLL